MQIFWINIKLFWSTGSDKTILLNFISNTSAYTCPVGWRIIKDITHNIFREFF